MKRVIFLLLISICSLTLLADNKQLSLEAEQMYKEGKYQEALTLYEQILNSGRESSHLYHNLGNCYYKLGENTQAILNYERALLLSPSDQSTQYNLKMAQRAIVDKINVLPEFFLIRWYHNIENAFSVDQWGYISTALFLLFLVMGGMFLYSPSRGFKKLGFIGGFLVLFIMLWTIYVAHNQENKLINRDYAIVVTPSVVVRGAPDNSGTELFVIHEGLKVKIIEQLGEWYNIQLADGNEGWLEKQDLAKI